jgi:apolipoprotein N-acyltransferase
VRDVALPMALSSLTPYARFGDWTLLIQLLLAGAAVVVLRRRFL